MSVDTTEELIKLFGKHGLVDRIKRLKSLGLIPDGAPQNFINNIVIHSEILNYPKKKKVANDRH